MRAFAIPVSTARLTLREFVAADFDAVHAYSSDPRVTRYLFFGPRDKDGSADYLQGLIESQRENPRTRFELAPMGATTFFNARVMASARHGSGCP